MTIEIIGAVSNFYIEFNATSLNVRDTSKRRVGQKQWETAQVIYLHESWEKIWTKFHINHP